MRSTNSWKRSSGRFAHGRRHTKNLVVHTSRFSVLGSCSGSVLVLGSLQLLRADFGLYVVSGFSRISTNVNTNGEPRTEKRERPFVLTSRISRHQSRCARCPRAVC